MVVLPFRTAKEAIELGNNTKFGLAGSVWTESVSLGLEVALNLKAGSIWINCHNLFDAAAGFGGYRQSGYGRDGGKEVSNCIHSAEKSWRWIFYLRVMVVGAISLVLVLVIFFQGLYEYVRPRWEGKAAVHSSPVDFKKFGDTIPSRPTFENVDIAQLSTDGATLPS